MKKKLSLVRESKRDASVFFLILIVLLAGGGVVAGALFINYDPIEEALATDQVIDTLFILEGEKSGDEPVRPLSTFVLMYYPATKRAAIFDIPGRVGLILKGVNRVDRIDTLYDSADITPYKNEVAAFIGDEIDYSVVYTLDDLEKIVDLIEGVELFIPSPVEMPLADPPVLFASGLCRLDGRKARSYLTYRLPQESDEAVHLRRQRFFYAFIKRLGEQNAFLKQNQVAKMYASLMQDEFAGINMDRVSIQSVAGTVREVSGQTLLLPAYNGSLIKEVVRQALVSLTQITEGQGGGRVYTVEVLNGTPTNGLAGRTAELLRGFGYDVISVGNADTSYDETLVIDQIGSQVLAENFGGILRCSNIQARDTASDEDMVNNDEHFQYKSDFILIIGRDFNGRYVTDG